MLTRYKRFAAGGVHGLIPCLKRLEQRGRHAERVVEVGQGNAGELGAGIEDGLGGGFDGGSLNPSRPRLLSRSAMKSSVVLGVLEKKSSQVDSAGVTS